MRFQLEAWCPVCQKFRGAEIGPDPLVKGRITEILHRHRRPWSLRRCPMSGKDADPVVAA